ncbi:hypothetical protein QJS66_06360 [Kocuria rhizophila]|nr:hypothetical protein QJS66_06360 [Kocuria rhizophila]
MAPAVCERRRRLLTGGRRGASTRLTVPVRPGGGHRRVPRRARPRDTEHPSASSEEREKPCPDHTVRRGGPHRRRAASPPPSRTR